MTITIAWWAGPVVLALLPFFYPEEGPMDFGAMFVLVACWAAAITWALAHWLGA